MGENIKLFRVFQYFDYSVLEKTPTGFKEHVVLNSNPQFGVCKNIYSEYDKQLDEVREKIELKTASDTVFVLFYDFALTDKNYEDLLTIYDGNREEMLLRVFLNNLLKTDTICIKGPFSMLFKNRINTSGFIS